MFTQTQYVLLSASLLFYVLSAIGLTKENSRLVYAGLLFSAVCIFGFAATLDDFLNIWDERFHVLVAKNMMADPMKPKLYADPVLDTSYELWARAHIWLHKQPLFMWQMAVSMKLFGTNVIAARIPSVLLSSFLVLSFYRSGLLLANRYAGFIAATLMLTSFYWIELVSGRQQLDQNDVSFVGYVSFSIWAYLEYYYSKDKRWLLIIGLFSGFAILCKWLAGLFVYAVWGIYSLLDFNRFKTSLTNMLKAFGVTVLVAAPWQIYTAIQFPAEHAKEQAYNFEHLWEPVEGHGGDWDYYLFYLTDYFGIATIWILVIAFFISLVFSKSKKLMTALLLAFLFQLSFFSWAATKMPSFAMVGWFIGILVLAFALSKIIDLFELLPPFNSHGALLCVGLGTIIILINFRPNEYQLMHGANGNFGEYISAMKHNKELFTNTKLESDYVLFNVNGYHAVEAMFYLGIPVYKALPTAAQIIELKDKNRRIAVLKGTGELPDYLVDNQNILLIEAESRVLE